MTHAAWYPRYFGHGIALAYPLAIVLGVMGILSFVESRALDSIIFFGGTGLLWSAHIIASSAITADPLSYSGWYCFIWSLFFCYVWLGSFRSGIVRMLYLLGLWLTMLALAIGNWGNVHAIILIGGYLGLITAILAAITSATTIIAFGVKNDANEEAASMPAAA
jgi:succinate-acetate transporter protein